MQTSSKHKLMQALGFVDAARRYWLTVFPHARRELRGWHERAAEIPDVTLRAHALATHADKSAHSEGAAAFAAIAPRAQRRRVVRALVAFQSMYDYLDTLSEQPGADPFANSCQLHAALVAALDPKATPVDYYARNPQSDDGGYLRAHVDTCRESCMSLPGYAVVAPVARHAAYRAMVSQGFNHALAEQGHAAPIVELVACWAQRQSPRSRGLRWWEVLGAAGSSLTIYALVAMAAHPHVSRAEVRTIERFYFPWAGALHGLLDSLVDQEQDARTGDHSHIARYGSTAEVADRLGAIASHAFKRALELPRGIDHAVILAAMGSYYLSTPEASSLITRDATRRVLHEAGVLARPTLAVLGLRRRVGVLVR